LNQRGAKPVRLTTPPQISRSLQMSAEPMGLRPAQTAAFMKEETERWAAVIRSAGVTLD